MIADAELERLAAERRLVLKDEPATTIEVLGLGDDAVVRKTYRNRGLRWLQTICRQSRAQREHDNLAAVAAAGVPCLIALGWSERRRGCFVEQSTLLTRFVPDALPLQHLLRAEPATSASTRTTLARAMGALLASLHRRGFLWSTPMPRNVLVQGEPSRGHLVVCDTPAVVSLNRDLHGGRLARIDLFLGAFSPSRRRDWQRGERWRWLLGYCDGDLPTARKLWRTMAPRGPLQNVVERALAMAFFTYILGRLRRGRRTEH